MVPQHERLGEFDAEGFYQALDAERQARSVRWRQVAQEAGVSPSTLTRMGQGRRPDVDSLAALCAWSGLQADAFVRTAEKHREAAPLAMISTYLRSDRNLTKESAAALDALIKAAYESLRTKEE